ncbi:MAG: hypothetical protein V3V08_23145 [Nannocystaceae bacterium]
MGTDSPNQGAVLPIVNHPTTGDVVGPGPLVTDDAVACWDGTGGLTLKEGTITCTAIAAHVASMANPHATDVGNLGSGTLAELNTAITDATLDDAGDSRPPDLHAIDGADHSFPSTGGTTWLDDEGNFTTPAGGGDVVQVGAPVVDETVAVYDDVLGLKIKGTGPVALDIVTRDTSTSEVDEVPVFTDTGSKVITGGGIKFINGALCIKQVNGIAGVATMELGDCVAKSSLIPGEVLLTSGTAEERFVGCIVIGGDGGDDVWIAILGECTIKCALPAVLLTEFLDPSATVGRAHPHASPTSSVFAMPVTTKGPAVLGTVRGLIVPREYF